MTALPALLEYNPQGKAQALQYGVLPLLVHLLRSSPSAVTLAAAANTLAVLAERDTELQGAITAAGGLAALLDRLEPSNTSAAAAAEAAQAAAAAAAAAAATAAAEVVARAASESQQDGSTAAAAAGDGEGAGDGGNGIAPGSSSSSGGAAVLGSQVNMAAMAAAAAAAAAADTGAADAETAAAARRVAAAGVRVACLKATAALAHDNSFTKNTARQQGVMLLLGELLQKGSVDLQAALLAEAAAAAAAASAQQHQLSRSASPGFSDGHTGLSLNPAPGPRHHGGLYVRTPRTSLSAAAAARPNPQQQQQQQAETAVALSLLESSVGLLGVLCHGNHSNQAAAAAEGLIDTLTRLAAAALGDSLETAGRHVALLAGACVCVVVVGGGG
jgi:hypothetical protein